MVHGATHSGSDSAQQKDFTTGRRVYSEGIAARLCQDLRPRSTLTADASGRESRDELFLTKNETSPGEFSVVGTSCGRRRFHGLGWPRSGDGTNRKEEISRSRMARS